MGKEEKDPLPAMMDTLRGLRGDLEKVCADALRDFERNTGLTVQDIELIRAMATDNTDPRDLGSERTRIAAVRITMRL